MNPNQDMRLVQNAAISSFPIVAVGCAGAFVLALIRLNAAYSAGEDSGELMWDAAFLAVPLGGFLVALVWAALRKRSVSRILGSPDKISELEQDGNRIRIFL